MESRFESCCQNCGTTDETLFQCHQCHVVSYCSRACKAADAKSHGRVCFEKVNENNPKPVSNITCYEIMSLFGSFSIYMDSECFTEKVVEHVMAHFPFYAVITDLLRIPHSNIHQTKQTKLVLLAQILENEVDSKNIFIKDIFGKTLYVIFNLKSPSPFFKWSELKPSKMICFRNPILHTFAGKLVLCINNSADIKVI